MTVRPAQPRVALGTLLQRAAPAPRSTRAALSLRATARALGAPHRTLADIEHDNTLATKPEHAHLFRIASEADTPTALILWVQVTTCSNCGTVHRIPSNTVLIQYAPNAHTVHQRRDDAALAHLPRGLPRLIKERDARMAFCETCFASGTASSDAAQVERSETTADCKPASADCEAAT